MDGYTLSPLDQWTFFENVSRAAFANPFGETRDNLDRNIGGAGSGSSGTEIIQAVVDRVAGCIQDMTETSMADLQPVRGEPHARLYAAYSCFTSFIAIQTNLTS